MATAPSRSPLQEQELFAGYSAEPRAFGEYAALMAAFVTSFGVAVAAAQRRHGQLPERISARDVVMGGVATQRLSRLITKDKVTSVVRAPFTREEGRDGPGEVAERPRGGRLRRTIGELTRSDTTPSNPPGAW